MEKDVLRKIELDKFTNTIGLEMGLAILQLAQKRHQQIAVEVSRLHHTIFLFVGEGLPPDKHNWLHRKANVARHFEESSLSVKQDLAQGNMTLGQTFGLDETEYLAKGGAIPVFVKGAGLVAIICVSGLQDEEDHKIIVEALEGTFFNG